MNVAAIARRCIGLLGLAPPPRQPPAPNDINRAYAVLDESLAEVNDALQHAVDALTVAANRHLAAPPTGGHGLADGAAVLRHDTTTSDPT